jgi:hypothetical protein
MAYQATPGDVPRLYERTLQARGHRFAPCCAHQAKQPGDGCADQALSDYASRGGKIRFIAVRAPMRQAEARITVGVVAARRGDLEAAISQGERALSAPRKSLPSLLMVSRDLTRVLNDQYPNEPATQAYLDQIHALSP